MLLKVAPLPRPLSPAVPPWIASNHDACVCFIFSVPSAGSRSSSPGKLLGHSSYGRIPRATASASTTPADKRSRIPRSQGCSRETSPSRMGLGKARALGHIAHTCRQGPVLLQGFCQCGVTVGGVGYSVLSLNKLLFQITWCQLCKRCIIHLISWFHWLHEHSSHDCSYHIVVYNL